MGQIVELSLFVIAVVQVLKLGLEEYRRLDYSKWAARQEEDRQDFAKRINENVMNSLTHMSTQMNELLRQQTNDVNKMIQESFEEEETTTQDAPVATPHQTQGLSNDSAQPSPGSAQAQP
jgi:hypothetical protein